MRQTILVLTAIASATTFSLVQDALAERRPYTGDRADVVVAHSRHGNGSVSGPVRVARYGYEVRLPGGTWVGCRRSCSETLRVSTIDYWENDGRLVGAGDMSNECGIFGCLELRWPR